MNLVHRGTAARNHLFKRQAAIGVLAEVLARAADRLAVLFGEFILFIVNHHFKQMNNGRQLSGAELIQQLMGVLLLSAAIAFSLRAVAADRTGAD